MKHISKKAVCLHFEVHQPFRLKRYRFFDLGRDHYYYDDYANESIMQRVASRCYLPANEILLDLIARHKGKFRVAFSISGLAIDQFRLYAPEVIDSFRELAATGAVEFLAETNSHSLASLKSREEFDAHGKDGRTVWSQTDSHQEHRNDLLRPDRIMDGRYGFQDYTYRGGKACSGLEKP
jgi:alpha-amylase/alpha-mannosidase (GH57 family)